MVLSNKKLKQKLRAALTQNQSTSNTNTNTNVAESDDPSSSSNSLKLLLDSASHTPRVSKREKLRKIRSLQPPNPLPSEEAEAPGEDEGGEKESGTEGLGNKKKKKKKKKNNNKKRKAKVDDDDVANGVVKDTNESKNKKQKKQKKQKKKKPKTVQENSSNREGKMPESTVLTNSNTNTTTSQENGDVVSTATKVYVGGIPYYSTEDDIRSYFEGCGTITEVDCMTFPESGKFRGIAIISFKTEAAAKRALALDGADMGGLFLKIQPYKAPTQPFKAEARFAPEMMEGYNRIYVGNLSWDITEDEVRKFFSKCNITSIKFGMDKETGEFRGYAHVDFGDSQSLKTALTLDQSVLFGRPVRISCAVPLKKKPGEQPSEQPSPTVSGKMKRRICYECREKGHTLSACPNKKTVASTTT